MKKIASVLLLAAVAPAAFAQTSAELGVTGKLIPGACTISLGENLLDWGDVSAADLSYSPTSPTLRFPGQEKQVSLDIDCTAPRRVYLQAVDAKNGTSIAEQYSYSFGLGLDAEGNKVGAFGVTVLSAPNVNGVSGYAGYVMPDGTVEGFSGGSKNIQNSVAQTNNRIGFSEALLADGASAPAIKTATSQVALSMVLNPIYLSGISEEIDMQGGVTFELVYL